MPAEQGSLAVAPDHRERVITAGCDQPIERWVLEAILEVGTAGLDEVRDYVTATPDVFVKPLR